MPLNISAFAEKNVAENPPNGKKSTTAKIFSAISELSLHR